jgi:hypothetical protein
MDNLISQNLYNNNTNVPIQTNQITQPKPNTNTTNSIQPNIPKASTQQNLPIRK